MKKKHLLLTLLALAIVTSLAAGTLAIYTKNYDLKDTSIRAKQFAFAVARTDSYKNDLTIAPTESLSYPFTISNQEGTALAEVPLKYEINVEVASLIAALTGMKAELYRDSDMVASSNTGNFTWTGTAAKPSEFEANKAATHNYSLKLTWVSDGTPNTDQTTQGEDAQDSSFIIKVTATQDTSK